MKALVLRAPGDPPKINVEDVPIPVLGPQDVLIKISACGVCFHDILVMRGILRRGIKTNVILGHELSGHVIECGSLVSNFAPGDLVTSILTDSCGFCIRCQTGREHRCEDGIGIGHGIDGGFAEYVKLRENSLVKLNSDTDPISACLFGCPMGVALHALKDTAKIQPNETVLITGAGGGLGVHLIQIAQALGAKTIAITSSKDKEHPLEELGCHNVFYVPDLDFPELILGLTEDLGADVIIDTLGAIAFNSCWSSLAQFGRMIILGDVQGGSVNIRPAEIIFKDAQIIGVSGASKAQLYKIEEMVSQQLIRPVISQSFRFEEFMQLYELMREKKILGRAILIPN